MEYHYPAKQINIAAACLNSFEQFQAKNGNLPHWDIPDKLQFVTFRLADSIPQSRLVEYRYNMNTWLSLHPKPWSYADEQEYNKLKNTYEKWLDAGYGECVMKDPAIRSVIMDSLLHDDGKCYDLLHFCIMPNHVHLLLIPYRGHELTSILRTIKTITAIRINRKLGRTGRLWMKESFDTVIRTEEQCTKVVRYISHNGDALNTEHYTVMVPIGNDAPWRR